MNTDLEGCSYKQRLLQPQKLGIVHSAQASIEVALYAMAIEFCDLLEIHSPTELEISGYAEQIRKALRIA